MVVLTAVVALSTVRGGSQAAFAGNAANVGSSLIADVVDPPTSLQAVGAGSITLTWVPSTDTYVTGHRVFRATVSGGPYTPIAEVTPASTAEYIDSPANGTYYYVARAFAGGWESVDGNEAAITFVTHDDFDAVQPPFDNCPTTFNVDRFDTDADTVGDACDLLPAAPSAGIFADSGQTLGSAHSFDIALGDLDGDDDLDAFVTNRNAPDTVWLNNGSGTFTDSGQALGGNAKGHDVTLGDVDVDGDGDIDAIVANEAQSNMLWLNNGSGTFTDSGRTLGMGKSVAVAIGDLDGDLDAFVTTRDAPDKVWLNNGSGVFTDSGQVLGLGKSFAVALADVDGDNDPDAMFGNDAANGLWLNS